MDSCYKLRQLFYYKLRQVLQSAMDLLQIATGITKCDDYYKLQQYMHLPHSAIFGNCSQNWAKYMNNVLNH